MTGFIEEWEQARDDLALVHIAGIERFLGCFGIPQDAAMMALFGLGLGAARIRVEAVKRDAREVAIFRPARDGRPALILGMDGGADLLALHPDGPACWWTRTGESDWFPRPPSPAAAEVRVHETPADLIAATIAAARASRVMTAKGRWPDCPWPWAGVCPLRPIEEMEIEADLWGVGEVLCDDADLAARLLKRWEACRRARRKRDPARPMFLARAKGASGGLSSSKTVDPAAHKMEDA